MAPHEFVSVFEMRVRCQERSDGSVLRTPRRSAQPQAESVRGAGSQAHGRGGAGRSVISSPPTMLRRFAASLCMFDTLIFDLKLCGVCGMFDTGVPPMLLCSVFWQCVHCSVVSF